MNSPREINLRPITVRSAKGLAIDGGLPMLAESLHVGRPNIGSHKRFLQRAARAFALEPVERLAQLVLAPMVLASFKQAAEFEASQKGARGFGSSGSR